MSNFLESKDFIELSDVNYHEAIVQFLKEQEITVDDFDYVGKCDSECPQCEAEDFSVWHEDIGYIKDDDRFTFDLNAADTVFDFAIYFCNKCGKWTTYIDPFEA